MRFLTEGLQPRAAAILGRQDAALRIGNLTLVHYGVNRGLQNRAFMEKRRALFEHSNLHLNRRLMQLGAWDEDAIAARGEDLFKFAVKIWSGPV